MANGEFEIRGVNHLALVCRDMEQTVDFYTGLLGMPLTKTIELPDGKGQHFFFDIGNGDTLAFFWFPDAPEPIRGVSSPNDIPSFGEFTTAIATINHDDSPRQISKEMHPGVFVRSLYFMDPDGILLEFAAWTRVFTEDDVRTK